MKDFDKWNTVKKRLDGREISEGFLSAFHEREVWFIAIGLNVGNEEYGKGDNYLRPVLILTKFPNGTFTGIPLTKKSKSGKFYFPISVQNISVGFAILSQLKTCDARRLYRKIGKMPHSDFEALQQKLLMVLKIKSPSQSDKLSIEL